MAGLINEQMQAPAEQEQMPMGAEGGEAGLDDPTFQQATQYLQEVLYGQQAAKEISQQLKSAPNLVDGMSSVAYDITGIVDEKTDGNVPDELLVSLAMQVLEEVVEIADATGLNPQPEDVALAFKQMILRYLQEQGLDTSQLDEAMSQVDPSVFRQASEENTEEA